MKGRDWFRSSFRNLVEREAEVEKKKMGMIERCERSVRGKENIKFSRFKDGSEGRR